jgi:hypothetical protein
VEKPKQFQPGDKPWPTVPLALLEQLELVYPDKSPVVTMSNREIWMAAGAAQVVRKLRQIREVQQTKVLQSS